MTRLTRRLLLATAFVVAFWPTLNIEGWPLVAWLAVRFVAWVYIVARIRRFVLNTIALRRERELRARMRRRR